MKRVADLSGAELDYWTAKADPNFAEFGDYSIRVNIKVGAWNPSSSWEDAGPIIEKMLKDGRLELRADSATYTRFDHPYHSQFAYQGEPLQAAMRCFVASVYGEEVSGEER